MFYRSISLKIDLKNRQKTGPISRLMKAKNLKKLPLILNGLDMKWYFIQIFKIKFDRVTECFLSAFHRHKNSPKIKFLKISKFIHTINRKF